MSHIAARNLTLLVVDDEPAIPRMLVEALKEPGLMVLTATRADKAIEIFRNHHATIDLVLLDLQMYPRNGLELRAELQQIDPNVRVAFMSGSPSEGQMEQLLEQSPATLFSKPFSSLAELAASLNEMMQKESV
jgi:CheY-like chemotaxis protein